MIWIRGPEGFPRSRGWRKEIRDRWVAEKQGPLVCLAGALSSSPLVYLPASRQIPKKAFLISLAR